MLADCIGDQGLYSTDLLVVNRNSMLNAIPYDMQSQARSIMNSIKGKSHVYGHIRADRVIFLIDISGSMGTEFKTDCGEYFNRLEYVVHDLHKILHHRVSKDFKFNIITFGHTTHSWHPEMKEATRHHLKEAEHYLDHLEPHGGTNTHDALRLALAHEEADAVYVLSDGEPTEGISDTDRIISDVKYWLAQRRNPVTINTIAFLMGHKYDDPVPRKFMAQLACLTPGGVYRCIDPNSPDSEEFARDGLTDSMTFERDADFAAYFNDKMSQMPNLPSLQNTNFTMTATVRDLLNVKLTLKILPPTVATQSYNSPMPTPMSPPMNSNSGYQPINYKAIAQQRTRGPQEIAIPTANEVNGHTIYNVTVVIQGVIPKPIRWSVNHNFAEFEKLHNSMKYQISQKALTNVLKLPAHTLFHHSDQAHIESRRSQLEAYLKTMYTYFDPTLFVEVDSFLMYDLNLSQAVAEQQILDQQMAFQTPMMNQQTSSPQPYVTSPYPPQQQYAFMPTSPPMNQQPNYSYAPSNPPPMSPEFTNQARPQQPDYTAPPLV